MIENGIGAQDMYEALSDIGITLYERIIYEEPFFAERASFQKRSGGGKGEVIALRLNPVKKSKKQIAAAWEWS